MRAAPDDAGRNTLGGTPGADPGASTEKVLAIVKDPSDPRHPRCATPVTGNRLSSLPRDDGHIMDDPFATVETNYDEDDTLPNAICEDTAGRAATASETHYRDSLAAIPLSERAASHPPLPLSGRIGFPNSATPDDKPKIPMRHRLEGEPRIIVISNDNYEFMNVPPEWRTCQFNFKGEVRLPDSTVRDFEKEFGVTVKSYPKFGLLVISKDPSVNLTHEQNTKLLDIIKKNMLATKGKFTASFDDDPFSL